MKRKSPQRRKKKTVSKKHSHRKKSKKNHKLPLIRIFLTLLFIFIIYVIYLDFEVRTQFNGRKWSVPARVYARPLELYIGKPLSQEQFNFELKISGYQLTHKEIKTGRYQKRGNRYRVVIRDFDFWDGHQPPRYIEVKIDSGFISDVSDFRDKTDIAVVRLEPAVMGRIYPSHQEDRLLVKLDDVPEQRIVVLSEFGEEMKGQMRRDICERLNRCLGIGGNAGYCWSNFAVPSTPKEEVTKDWILKLKEICIRLNRCSGIDKNVGSCWRCQTCKEKIGEKQLRTIPADIGLRISLCSGKKPQVHCVLCERFSDPDDFVWVPFGNEEALFYLCGSCSRSKSMDVKIAKFKSVLEFGRPLRSAPPSLPSKKKTTTKQQGKDEI